MTHTIRKHTPYLQAIGIIGKPTQNDIQYTIKNQSTHNHPKTEGKYND